MIQGVAGCLFSMGWAELEVSGDCGWMCPPLCSTLWGRTAKHPWGQDHGTTHRCRPVQCVPVPAPYSCPVSPRGAGALMGEGSAAGGWRLRGGGEESPAQAHQPARPGTPGGTCCVQPLRSGDGHSGFLLILMIQRKGS